MARTIDNLRWECKWVSQLGCIKGCLDYLGVEVSDAWLYGVSGYAFILNMHEVVCPSGPTAWNTSRMLELVKNAGCDLDCVFVHKSADEFEEKRKAVWERTRQAIDEGLPCYGWELDIPEFYVVYGYDDEGYYFSGPMHDDGGGPKPWRELGESGIGFIEMFFLKKGPVADDGTAVKQALEFAVEHSANPQKWILPKYKSGLDGFDIWINALESGTANPWGMAYNSAVWAECREHAAAFFGEMKERLGTDIQASADEAGEHYSVSANNLKDLSRLFPFPPQGEEVKNDVLCRRGVELLKKSKEADAAGLAVITRIAQAL